jgi:hypothetical protein
MSKEDIHMYTKNMNDRLGIVDLSTTLHSLHNMWRGAANDRELEECNRGLLRFVHGLTREQMDSLRDLTECESCHLLLDSEKERRIENAKKKHSQNPVAQDIYRVDRSPLLQDAKDKIARLQMEVIEFEDAVDHTSKGTTKKEKRAIPLEIKRNSGSWNVR